MSNGNGRKIINHQQETEQRTIDSISIVDNLYHDLYKSAGIRAMLRTWNHVCHLPLSAPIGGSTVSAMEKWSADS